MGEVDQGQGSITAADRLVPKARGTRDLEAVGVAPLGLSRDTSALKIRLEGAGGGDGSGVGQEDGPAGVLLAGRAELPHLVGHDPGKKLHAERSALLSLRRGLALDADGTAVEGRSGLGSVHGPRRPEGERPAAKAARQRAPEGLPCGRPPLG